MKQLFNFCIIGFFLTSAVFASSSANFSLQGGLSSSGKIISSSNSNLNIIEEYHEVLLQTSNSYRLVSGFRSFFQIARLGPIVTSITPNHADNDRPVNITNLAGANFQTGATVKLSKTGQTDITATAVTVVSSDLITCSYNITGAVVGLWDVTVTNPDGKSTTLNQAFKIEAPSLEITGPILNYPNPFNPATGPTVIRYNLTRDADVTLYLYNLRAERIWEYSAAAGSPGGQAGFNEITWNGLTAFKSVASSGVYILYINAKVNGETKILGKGKIAIIK